MADAHNARASQPLPLAFCPTRRAVASRLPPIEWHGCLVYLVMPHRTRNGAGKTTTVRVLGTLIAPTSGSATVAGIPLTPENGVEIRRRISVMPESPGLYLRLSVIENLECFADLYEVDDPAGRIGRALQAVNLIDRAHDPCG